MPTPLPLSNYAIILACVIVVALGQLLFKTVGTRLGNQGFEALLTDHTAAGLLFTALALYGMSTLGWVLALRTVPLSTAYLFMSLSFVIVPGLAWYFLGETVSVRFFIGSAMIMLGIILAAG